MRLHCDDTQHVKGERRTFLLDARPEYQALSYCWTAVAPICEILVNNVPVQVRPNLFNYLALGAEEKDESWIFIDAVCIDQDNLAERSSQVSRMGDIYQAAKSVVVWLGMEDRWERCDVEAARAIRQHCQGSARLDLSNFREALQIPLLSTAFRKAFLDPEYWLRACIVQEVALARHPVLKYQNLKLDFSTFKNLLRLFDGEALWQITEKSNISEQRASELREFEAPGDFFALSQILDESRMALEVARTLTLRSYPHKVTEYNLSTAVRAFAMQRCSVWHDKVYALLGLTGSTLKADYLLTRKELYAGALIEGALPMFWPLGSHRISIHYSALIHFILALCHALALDLGDPTVSHLTQRAMTNCGIEDPQMRFKEVIESSVILGDPCADLEGHQTLTMKILRRIENHITMHQNLTWKCMPAKGNERRRTLSDWTDWVDQKQEETVERLLDHLDSVPSECIAR